MATLANIGNPVWGMSIYGYGVIVEGITAIRQRMDLAIRTTKGSDPLRPEFGSNVYKYIDAPSTLASPNITREILDALSLWVPEIKVKGIKSYLKAPGNLVFEVTFSLVDDFVSQTYSFETQSTSLVATVNSEITLQAFFPSNQNGLWYNFNFLKNGITVLPYPNPVGFETIADMFTFMKTNYSYLGRWFLLADRIICYMKADGVTSASLAINLLQTTVFKDSFPQLSAGEYYQVTLTYNGVIKQSPATLPTVGDVFQWVKENWSDLATWTIQYFVAGLFVGEFSDEFSNEFSVDEVLNGYILVGNTLLPAVKATVNIEKV